MLIELYNIWSKFDKVPHILLLSGSDVSLPSGIPYFPIEKSILKKDYKEKMLGLDNPFIQEEISRSIEKNNQEKLENKSKIKYLRNSLNILDDNCKYLYFIKENKERNYNSLESIEFWGEDSYEKYLNSEVLFHNPPELWNWIFNKREKLLFLEANNIHYNFLKMQDELSNFISFGTSTIDGLIDNCGIEKLIEFNGNILKNRKLSKEEVLQVRNHSAIIFKDINNHLIRPDILFQDEKLDIQKIINLHLLKIQTDIIVIIGGGKDTIILWNYIENIKKYKQVYVIEINEYGSHILSDITIKLPILDVIDTFSSLVIDLQKNHIKRYG